MAVKAPKFRYTAVTGYFQHDDEPASPSFEAVTAPGLGLIDQAYLTDKTFDPRRETHGWERFAHYLQHLNESERGKAAYKLIYATRHGEGYHNVKEKEVGTTDWEAYWAKLDGDGRTTWADSHLTQVGIRQALAMKVFWQDASFTLRLPLPGAHYSSPHARCLQTCELSFSGVALPSGEMAPFKPVVRELIRERLGVHTCDRRGTRTWIRDNYPSFAVEDDFPEQDELWQPNVRETLAEHAARVEAFLADLFTNESATICSITAHSGTFLALYSAIGHKAVHVAPGNVVPVLIKAEVVGYNDGNGAELQE